MLSLIGIEEPELKDPMVEFLEMMIELRGEPLVVMPFEYYQLLILQ